MAGSLKGNLGLKSSPLAPTSAKLTSQYLVLDHMNNHYRKIIKAKPAIDNKPPKSISTSQKVRERKERDYIKKYGGSRPTSRMSAQSFLQAEVDHDNMYNEELWNDPEDEEERLVYDIMRTTLKGKPQGSTDATFGSESQKEQLSQTDNLGQTVKTLRDKQRDPRIDNGYRTEKRPLSSRSNHSLASNTSRTSLSVGRKPNPTYDGDLLEKRSHVFTEPEKPFTPRTLKSTRQSRLSEYKYYTPPPKKREGKGADQRDQTNRKMEETQIIEVRPKPKPRNRSPLNRTERPLSETTLMFESLQSRDFRQFQKEDEVVPRLDISVDKDHLNWLQEQANKAQHRVKNGGLHNTMGQIQEEKGKPNGETLTGTETMNLKRSGNLTKSFGTKTWTSQRMNEAEEEQKYVQFAKEVTEDVITQGIYTDRVLQKVFERHVEKRKGELKVSRMHAILSKLRTDLGITTEREDYLDDDELVNGLTTVSSLDQSDHTLGAPTDYTLGAPTQTLEYSSSKLNPRAENSTLNSTNTYNFNSTTDMFSTIRSEVDVAGAEDLTATQALEQYQMDITKRDTIVEEVSQTPSEADTSEKLSNMGAAEETFCGVRSPGEVSQSEGESQTYSPQHVARPQVKPRRPVASPKPSPRGSVQEQEVKINTQSVESKEETVDAGYSHQIDSNINVQEEAVIKSDINERKDDEALQNKPAEDEVEDYVEDYEDDYDADDDDGQGGTTHRTSDDDF